MKFSVYRMSRPSSLAVIAIDPWPGGSGVRGNCAIGMKGNPLLLLFCTIISISEDSNYSYIYRFIQETKVE